MITKEFVKLFVPPVLNRVYLWVRWRFRQLQKSELPQIEHHSNKIIIIGNGPSLNESLALYKDKILSCDKIAVNHFASTDLFEDLKPNLYVLVDPKWFVDEKEMENIIKLTLTNIVNKTKWPLHLFIPSSSKSAPALSILGKNTNISIGFFQTENQNVYSMTKYEAWDKNLLSTPSRNVLQTSLYLSLFWNYKEIYLIGADFSFIEGVHIDQNTNELYMIEPHFYREKSVGQEDERRLKDNLKLHEKLARMAETYSVFEELADYALHKKAKVYNASEFSWIDSFPRKKL